MNPYSVPQDVSVDDFFKQYVPLGFRMWTQAHPIEGMEGTEFTMQYRIAGEGGGTYGIRVKDGTELEILEGEMDHAMLSIEISEEDWRDTVTGKFGGTEEWMQSQERPSKERLETLRGIQGTLELELERPDGGVLESKITFNMVDTPKVLLKMKLDDYVAMQKGELRGQEAFLSGRMRVQGDMAFLMRLDTLNTARR
jgi:putative sterol carrier protein